MLTLATANSSTVVFGCPLAEPLVFRDGGGAEVVCDAGSTKAVFVPGTYTAVSGGSFSVKMFKGCFTSITGGNYTSTNCKGLFQGLKNLETLTLPPGFGAAATKLSSMFYDCSALESAGPI